MGILETRAGKGIRHVQSTPRWTDGPKESARGRGVPREGSGRSLLSMLQLKPSEEREAGTLVNRALFREGPVSD